MRRWSLALLAFLVAGSFLWVGGRAEGYSLWQGEKAAESSLFRDRGPIAFKKHDLITILIEEESSASNEATLEMESKYDLKLNELDLLITLLTDKRYGTDELAGPEGDYMAEKKMDKEASAERTDRLRARITAEVVEVLPNGNLILEARKKIAINEEKQEITLTGMVRPENVSSDYTVLSRYLADADITLKGEGPVTRGGSRRGWLARIIDLLWPF